MTAFEESEMGRIILGTGCNVTTDRKSITVLGYGDGLGSLGTRPATFYHLLAFRTLTVT